MSKIIQCYKYDYTTGERVVLWEMDYSGYSNAEIEYRCECYPFADGEAGLSFLIDGEIYADYEN